MSGDLNLVLQRKGFFPTWTSGELFANGIHFGFTCEDPDRKLEDGGTKIQNETAIPRGKYRVILSKSVRFGKIMPEVLGVPQFSGIRFHGLNTAAQSQGCVGVGAELTPTGIRDCATVNAVLIRMIGDCIAQGNKCWLEVK